MIGISDNITLIPITADDQEKLSNLMSSVYPPPYSHIWKDDCSWYLEKFYGEANFEQEINEKDTEYYFVRYDGQLAGNLRICYGADLADHPGVNASKLNRIYLDQSIHGRGIGKALVQWTEEQCRVYGSKYIWLEAMDTQTQALKFYESIGFEICGSMHLDFNIMLPEYRGMKRLKKTL